MRGALEDRLPGKSRALIYGNSVILLDVSRKNLESGKHVFWIFVLSLCKKLSIALSKYTKIPVKVLEYLFSCRAVCFCIFAIFQGYSNLGGKELSHYVGVTYNISIIMFLSKRPHSCTYTFTCFEVCLTPLANISLSDFTIYPRKIEIR